MLATLHCSVRSYPLAIPPVIDDNSFSETLLRTLKYRRIRRSVYLPKCAKHGEGWKVFSPSITANTFIA